MARLLGMKDLVAIQQLQRRGVELDSERAVLWPHSPLRAALAAHWPLSPVGAETFILYPTSGRGRALGFLQARHRRKRPEADISFIAPALDAREDAVSTWYRLLAESTQRMGDMGMQRFFAEISAGNGEEDVLRQAGFSVYAHEDVYRLPERPGNLAKGKYLRRQRTRDQWDLLRLYSQLTPRQVQMAEGMMTKDGQPGRMIDWWDQTRGAGYILPAGQELAGSVRLVRGSAAFWLRFWLNPQMHDYADLLLQEALSLLRAAPRRPIYCSVREYESGIRAPLEIAGFRHLHRRSLLVKHTTARIKEPALKLVPALEKSAERATSIVHQS